MKDIRNVAVLGAGAVGSYFIWCFTQAGDPDFFVIAGGSRKKRMEEQGVRINDKVCRPRVLTPEEAGAEGVDLLIVALKYYSLRGALDDIAAAVGPDTVVITAMNGIDSEQVVGGRIGMAHMLLSVMWIASRRTEKGVYFDPASVVGLTFGEADGNTDSPRVLAAGARLDEAGVRYKIRANMRLEMWSKYSANICYNLPQAVLDVPNGANFVSADMAFLRDRLEDEVLAVGHAEGVTELRATKYEVQAPFMNAKYSTLQDILAGRHTEVDMFLGVLIDLAVKHGIDVPYARCVYHMIKVLEQRNDGMFDDLRAVTAGHPGRTGGTES